ncbi:hypothetical protein [Tuwongella immobilis]|uniref:Potassium channel domain-containing protein n=1 Tax=Tuwongella immobilis TaxID=692036 RepID=A0A6C2YK87_9BACT|nr:hypothetical protein [Tuwongella immobilis]VIP01342.1 Uncharacterized protein OS=Planctomyces limnophilus (strain ATCC 43296 / DSM 3776 / IFAM 1008 / 290) GN=Plim_3674 PE=4 SV=1 [Tuwongella immobilis]VTR98119.1 Uncharacterized protein OS=Planctomyces limnophilus (strain ATCC 43296 / DSM 3776 / IFAM 1008 / 290) GN=Plim_3674 PE=4 SV=1 [Tuwongella immobilis]
MSNESPEPEETDDLSKSRNELPAHEVLEKIRNGETISNVRINRLRLRGEFTTPVRFKNCTVSRLIIENATFTEDVQFFRCTLDRPDSSRKNIFAKGLDLNESTIIRGTFRGLHVRGQLSCREIRAKGKLLFADAEFQKVFFWDANIEGWFEFKNCKLEGSGDFRSMQMAEGCNFIGCQFQQEFLLRGTSVTKKLDFGNSRFEKMLDLSKAKLYDFVYLEEIHQGEQQQFAFENAIAERIRIRPEQVEGRLASEQTGKYESAMQEYGLLKQCFQNLHRFDQEDWAFYRFKVNQRRGVGRSWKRPWTKVGQFANWLFLDLGCGYGTNPFRAVVAAMVIILSFGLIYSVGIEQFNIDASEYPFEGAVTDVVNRTVIGMMTSMAVFTSGLGDSLGRAHGWMNLPLIVEAFLGTLLFGLFIVAFSRKVIR